MGLNTDEGVYNAHFQGFLIRVAEKKVLAAQRIIHACDFDTLHKSR
jgi:hypothetical protein